MTTIKNLYNNQVHSDLIIYLQNGSKLFAHRIILSYTAPSLQPLLSTSCCGGAFSGNTFDNIDFTLFDSNAVQCVIAMCYGVKLKTIWQNLGWNIVKIEERELYKCTSIMCIEIYKFILYLGSDWVIKKLNKRNILPSFDNLLSLLLFICKNSIKARIIDLFYYAEINDTILVEFAKVSQDTINVIINNLRNTKYVDKYTIISLFIFYNFTHDDHVFVSEFKYSLSDFEYLIVAVVFRAYIQQNSLADLYYTRALKMLQHIINIKTTISPLYKSLNSLFDLLKDVKNCFQSYNTFPLFCSDSYQIKDCIKIRYLI